MKLKYFPRRQRIFSILIFIFLSLSWTVVPGQIPQGIPKHQDNDPVALDYLPDVILYILLPAVLIVIYLIILYRKRKKRQQENQENSEVGKKQGL